MWVKCSRFQGNGLVPAFVNMALIVEVSAHAYQLGGEERHGSILFTDTDTSQMQTRGRAGIICAEAPEHFMPDEHVSIDQFVEREEGRKARWNVINTRLYHVDPDGKPAESVAGNNPQPVQQPEPDGESGEQEQQATDETQPSEQQPPVEQQGVAGEQVATEGTEAALNAEGPATTAEHHSGRRNRARG